MLNSISRIIVLGGSLQIRSARKVGLLGEYLLSGIVGVIDVGDVLLVGIDETIDLGDGQMTGQSL